jgi:peptidyl-prolyl cis-trans isomerase D
MLLGQIANAYSASNFITDSELESIAELTQQTRDFRYVSVTMGTRTLGNAISQEEIQRYYDENPAEFTQEESVDVNYVVLDRNVIADEIQVDEAEIRAQYDAQRADFEGSSEKRASQILFEVGGTMDEAAAMDLAATARQRLLDGEDFGAVALELSSDTVSAEEGGDIGYTDGSAFPQPIEAALETLALNEISEPVVTEFGVHVVKLTEDAENVYQAFEEISDRIERELKSAEVDLLFAERIEDMSNLAIETGDLITISEQLGLEIQSADSVPRAGSSGLFANQALVTAAFSDEVMLEGNNSDVIEIGDNQAVVLRVQQFNESAVLPLDDVMGEISIILRTQMEREAVQSLGEDLLIAAEEGGDVGALLADNELEWLDVENISRNDFSVNREVIDHVFTMAAPESEPIVSSVSLANGTFVLVELNQVNPGEFSAIPEPERNRLVDSLKSDLGVSDYQSFLLSLREGSDISAAMLEEVL